MVGSRWSRRDRWPRLYVHHLPDMLDLMVLMFGMARDRFLLRGWFHWLWVMLQSDALPRFKSLPWGHWCLLHQFRKLARWRLPL